MFVVGLTGGIGSGKSTIAAQFEALGIELIDADLLAREVVEPGSPALAAIAAHFGQEFIGPGGELERQRLRQVIFADAREKDWLEHLLHPLIEGLMREHIGGCRSPYCILVSPLLLETGQKRLVDRVLVVDVSEETQLERALRRDQESDEATIRAIIASQLGRDQRLQQADDILDNDRPLDQIGNAIQTLHRQYLEFASQYEPDQAS